ncbi:hypothetical protein [Streptomyces sp. NPDC000134]|uniref:hypothetical protein n=1 Tax=Streptomyces sp. NPDC000134 TaxID=3364536 RepID=UPI003680B136
MHRTTTTAALLVTVAVSALGGCTTVQRPPAPAPAATGAGPSVPRPDGPARPRVVQAPAREALELIGDARRPDRAAGEPRRTPPPTAPAPRERPAGRPQTRPAPVRPAPREPDAGPPHRPDGTLPEVTASVPGIVLGGGDLCGLGRRYGGWRSGSPEATVCERTYGR